MVEEYKAFIGGNRVKAKSGEIMEIINPATGQVIATAAKCGPVDVGKAVKAAVEAAPSELQRQSETTRSFS